MYVHAAIAGTLNETYLFQHCWFFQLQNKNKGEKCKCFLNKVHSELHHQKTEHLLLPLLLLLLTVVAFVVVVAAVVDLPSCWHR